MRGFLQWIGETISGFIRRTTEKPDIPATDPINTETERTRTQEEDEKERPIGPGCLIAAVLGIALGVGVALGIGQLLSSDSDDGDAAAVDGPVAPADAGDDASTDDPSASAEGAGSFTAVDDPDLLIPTAGDWAIDNGMFVPNCGPDDPEPETAVDAGTIDVWGSGAVLELQGPEGEALVFERTASSAESASYTGGVGFVAIELVFRSPTAFDATISYSGENECVRRSATGVLAAGDAARQHGAEAFSRSTGVPEVGIDQATEGTIGIVTIGDDRWEFFPEGPVGTCDADFFGGFTAVLYSEGFVNSLNVDLVPDGSRVSTVTMKLQGEDLDLVADEEAEWAAVAPGTSAVLEYSIDGPTASGRVSFINEDRAFNAANFPLDAIEATFTVTCGP